MLKIVYQRRPKASTLNSRRHIVMCMVGAKIITQIDCETNHLKALLSSMHRLNTMSASDIVVITLNKHWESSMGIMQSQKKQSIENCPS